MVGWQARESQITRLPKVEAFLETNPLTFVGCFNLVDRVLDSNYHGRQPTLLSQRWLPLVHTLRPTRHVGAKSLLVRVQTPPPVPVFSERCVWKTPEISGLVMRLR